MRPFSSGVRDRTQGTGHITIRDLVRNSLRMRPDRIIIGEVRGAECLDMLQAMNTGHDGSLSTLHANTPIDATKRMETMVLMAGMEMPVRAIREQIVSAVDMIVQVTRFPNGRRRITHISEVTEIDLETGQIRLEDIFVLRDPEQPRLRHTGYLPTFTEQMLEQKLIDVDLYLYPTRRTTPCSGFPPTPTNGSARRSSSCRCTCRSTCWSGTGSGRR